MELKGSYGYKFAAYLSLYNSRSSQTTNNLVKQFYSRPWYKLNYLFLYVSGFFFSLFSYSRVGNQVSQPCKTDKVLPCYHNGVSQLWEDLGVNERIIYNTF
jgi:hypothetical protein